MADFLKVCEQAARIGGQVLREWQGRIAAREKGPRDLVTQADLASQAAIREFLLDRFTDHDFLGEEDGEAGSLETKSSEFCWVVDPLDGTMNYVHGLPGFAVSVAVLQRGKPVAGVVFDPLLDECFAACKGGGSFLNGRPLKTSGCKRLSDALLAASFSANVTRGSLEITRFVEALHASQAIRRLGSAALNLCYVASGRIDGYWATSVKVWDVAAGLLILSEAGGISTNITGGPLDLAEPKLAVSATGELQNELIALLAQAAEIRQPA